MSIAHAWKCSSIEMVARCFVCYHIALPWHCTISCHQQWPEKSEFDPLASFASPWSRPVREIRATKTPNSWTWSTYTGPRWMVSEWIQNTASNINFYCYLRLGDVGGPTLLDSQNAFRQWIIANQETDWCCLIWCVHSECNLYEWHRQHFITLLLTNTWDAYFHLFSPPTNTFSPLFSASSPMTTSYKSK